MKEVRIQRTKGEARMFTIELAGRRILFTEMQDILEAGNCATEILWGNLEIRTIVVVSIPASRNLVTFLNDMKRSRIAVHYCFSEADMNDAECAIAVATTVGGSSISYQRIPLEEFTAPAIVASNKPIGLLATLVALGIGYPGIKFDLEVLAGESQRRLSSKATWLLERWNSIPSLVREEPEIHEEKVEKLFRQFLERAGLEFAKITEVVEPSKTPLPSVCTLHGLAIRIDPAHMINK